VGAQNAGGLDAAAVRGSERRRIWLCAADFGISAAVNTAIRDLVVRRCPGFVDAELERLDPLTTLREREYAFFAGDEFPGVRARHGVALA
jgi:predicted glycoside hydrolase/deacetylase ChbG (UPF0249 family)